MIYLDWAATAPADPEILNKTAQTALHTYGNPSSLHVEGKKALDVLNTSRRECASLLGAGEEHIFFTSGGTESNNLVLFSLLNRTPLRGEIIISGIEHASVWEPAHALKKFGYNLKIVNPSKNGRINPDKIAEVLTSDTKMVCIMAVNNETGAVQPVEEIAGIISEAQGRTGRPVYFHCDMVQSPGKDFPGKLDNLGIDSASFSGHKIGAPRGIGLLYARRDLSPLYCGGGQERGIRPGTENISSAAAMAEALTVYGGIDNEAAAKTERLLEKLSSIEGIRILPADRLTNPQNYAPQIFSLSCSPVPGEVMQRVLSENGFYVSTGSACSSKKEKKTRVIEAMGISAAEAFCSIRVSFGRSTKTGELDHFASTFIDIYEYLKNQLQ